MNEIIQKDSGVTLDSQKEFEVELSHIETSYQEAEAREEGKRKMRKTEEEKHFNDQKKRLETARRLITTHNKGWPTKLEEQITMHFGFDRKIRENILTFAKKVNEAEGELIVVAHTYDTPGHKHYAMGLGGCTPIKPMIELGTPQTTDFYVGRIDRLFSLPERGLVLLLNGDASILPIKEVWMKHPCGKPTYITKKETCIEFPSALFLYHLAGLGQSLAVSGQIEMAIGSKEMGVLIDNLSSDDSEILENIIRVLHEKEGDELHQTEEQRTGQPANAWPS